MQGLWSAGLECDGDIFGGGGLKVTGGGGECEAEEGHWKRTAVLGEWLVSTKVNYLIFPTAKWPSPHTPLRPAAQTGSQTGCPRCADEVHLGTFWLYEARKPL